MTGRDLATELAALRRQIASLRQREVMLERALESVQDAGAPPRPGWPIRRLAAAAQPATGH